jgi:hypothetical protein
LSLALEQLVKQLDAWALSSFVSLLFKPNLKMRNQHVWAQVSTLRHYFADVNT